MGKKLIFIDNDDISRAERDVKNYVAPFLNVYGGISKKQASGIEIISDLYKKEKDDLYKIFYSGENAIITWSVYTPTAFHNSKQQLLHFLAVAGRSKVRDIIYIDMSGMMKESFSATLKYDELKSLYHILTAIESNNIISVGKSEFVRLRINLSSEDVFIEEKFNLKKALNSN